MIAYKLALFSHAAWALTPVKTYTVDMAHPPATRWNHIFDDPANANYLADTYNYFKGILHHWTDFLTLITQHASWFFPIDDHVEEMKGIAAHLHAKNPDVLRPLGLIIAANLLYQLEGLDVKCAAMNTTGPCPTHDHGHHAKSFCSSIVAVDAHNTTCLGRNMDWNFPQSLLKYVINVNMVRGNEKLFSGVFVLGTVGVLHGMNDNFAVSLNARNNGGGIMGNLLALFMKRITPMQLIRVMLASKRSFADALKVFKSKYIANDAYFNIADGKSPNGAIVSRGRTSAEDVWYLNQTTRQATHQPTWFHVQTNYDPDKEEPSYDARRAPAVRHMENLTRAALNPDTLLEVMTQYPTFNRHTDIVSVMCPARQINMQYTTDDFKALLHPGAVADVLFYSDDFPIPGPQLDQPEYMVPRL